MNPSEPESQKFVDFDTWLERLFQLVDEREEAEIKERFTE